MQISTQGVKRLRRIFVARLRRARTAQALNTTATQTHNQVYKVAACASSTGINAANNLADSTGKALPGNRRLFGRESLNPVTMVAAQWSRLLLVDWSHQLPSLRTSDRLGVTLRTMPGWGTARALPFLSSAVCSATSPTSPCEKAAPTQKGMQLATRSSQIRTTMAAERPRQAG